MGDMSGPINCAPIITAGRLSISPRVASALENRISIKKSISGEPRSTNSLLIALILHKEATFIAQLGLPSCILIFRGQENIIELNNIGILRGNHENF